MRRLRASVVVAVVTMLLFAFVPATGASWSASTASTGSSWAASSTFQTGPGAAFGKDDVFQAGTRSEARPAATVLTPMESGPAESATAVSASGHACALRGVGELWCWGDNSSGQLGTGDGLDRAEPVRVGTSLWFAVSTGGAHTCGIRLEGAVTGKGSLWCWGANDRGQLAVNDTTDRYVPARVGTLADWFALDVGLATSCAIRPNSRLFCWGANDAGQAGADPATTPQKLAAQEIEGAGTWKDVTVGDTHSCAIYTTGGAWCFGSDARGQLGLGAGDQTGHVRAAVNAGAGWLSLTAGASHTCGVRVDGSNNGQLLCWGRGDSGQLGRGSTADADVPTAVGTATWLGVSAGQAHTCGVRLVSGSTGSLWCWGSRARGQLGVGAAGATLQTSPLQVGAATNWTDVAVSGSTSCALREVAAPRRTTWCWGADDRGQIGRGHPDVFQPLALLVDDPTDQFLSFAGGTQHSCGVRGSGTLWCWGSDALGQLGLPGTGPQVLPAQVGAGTTWLGTSAGTSHTCALDRERKIWCTGDNTEGQLGLADRTARTTLQVVPGEEWTSVAAGGEHTCAIAAEGRLFCWGRGDEGQLGGGTVDRLVPTAVDARTDYAQVSVGNRHTCAVRTDSRAFCWGDNARGQAGQANTAVDFSTPTAITGGTTFTSVQAGAEHTCATRTTGAVACWGRNDRGQVGDGTKVDRVAPTTVGSGTTWASVAAGYRHSCGLRTTGSVACWGANTSGELGTGTAATDRTSETTIPSLRGRLVAAGADSQNTFVTFGPLGS